MYLQFFLLKIIIIILTVIIIYIFFFFIKFELWNDVVALNTITLTLKILMIGNGLEIS